MQANTFQIRLCKLQSLFVKLIKTTNAAVVLLSLMALYYTENTPRLFKDWKYRLYIAFPL